MNRVAISVLYLLEVYLLEIKCRNHWVMGEGSKTVFVSNRLGSISR